MRTQKFDDEKRKLGALVLAKTFRLVAFQFQCSIIVMGKCAVNTKKKKSLFLRKLGKAINQDWLHCATKQRTKYKKGAMTSHKNYIITDGINSCRLQHPT
jgi:hypothetical protein